MSKSLLLSLKVLLIAILSIFYMSCWNVALHFAPVNPDAGYYLSVARWITEGKVLFSEIATIYPPLAYYPVVWLGTIFNSSLRYNDVQLLMLTSHLISAAILLVLLRRSNHNVTSLTITILVYLTSLIFYEGIYYSLETLALIPLLLAITFVSHPTKNKTSFYIPLVSGLFLGLSILVKQYCVLVLPAILGYLWITSSSKQFAIARSLFLVSGLLIPLLTMLTALQAHGVSIGTIWSELFFNSYKMHFSNATMIIVFVVHFSFLAFLPTRKFSTLFKQKEILLSVLVLAFLSPTLLVRQYKHYFILFLPFVVWLGFGFLSYSVSATKGFFRIATFISCLTTLILTLALTYLSINYLVVNELKAKQHNKSRTIARYVNNSQEVLLLADPAFYHLNNLYTLDEHSRIDYTFLDNLIIEKLTRKLYRSPVLILDLEDKRYLNPIVKKLGFDVAEFCKELKRRGYIEVTPLNSTISIWKNPRASSSF